jgi:hypothetical protein
MDIEQLKLVLQSVDGITEGAKQIGLAWFIFEFFKVLAPYIFWGWVFAKLGPALEEFAASVKDYL